MYQIYKKVQKAVVWVFMAIVYFTEVFIPVILCAQVIGRKFLHSPILGAEELASFAFTAMVLFGSAAICYQKKYIERFSIPEFDEDERKLLRTGNRQEVDEMLLEKYDLVI